MFRLLLIFILLSQYSFAQTKYWVTFKDKDINGYNYLQNISPETIKNRNSFGLPLYQYTDVPVNKNYIDSLEHLGIKVLCKSKWLNSISAFLTQDQVTKVSSFSFVNEVSIIDRRIEVTGNMMDVNPQYYVIALKQMQAEKFSDEKLTGKGVTVGVIDAGFFRAFEDKNLSHLFNEKRLLNQRDFLAPTIINLVGDTTRESDYHGRIVLNMICGYDSSSRIQYGLAPNAKFYLARSENDAKEYRGEEDNWISAMEWMDSMGVRLINTSLGYSTNMDDPKDNYKQEEMDGKTARISKAAQIASDEKGIFLVVSAGNSGNEKWRIISAPADAEGALAVGATEDPAWQRIGYSSVGPEFLSYLKPNVSCYSLSGTSFSAPAVTGFVACLMEKDSTLNNKQLKSIVERSGHLYPYGNNFIGYGVPQAGKALKLIEDQKHEFGNFSEKVVKSKKFTLKLDKAVSIEDAVVFHKKSKTSVLKQDSIKMKNGRFVIKRYPGATYTTISFGLEVLEIIWK